MTTQPIAPPGPERPTAVYWLYDDVTRLLYVGMTNNPVQRFIEHRDDKPWWPTVCAYAIRWFDTRARAEAAEHAAILNDGPAYNVEHQPRNQPDGGLPAIPSYVGYQFRRALADFVAELLPDAPKDERFRLIDDMIARKLHDKVFIFYRPSSPTELHKLDLNAMLAALGAFGPVVAPKILTETTEGAP